MPKKKRRSNQDKSKEIFILDAKACVEKDKVPYKSQNEAENKIKEIAEVRPWLDLKVYYCSFCKHWHLARKLINKSNNGK